MGYRMAEKKIYPPNGFRVCVDSREDDISGLVYSPLKECPISYTGFNELMLKMDQVFDKSGYPQAFQVKRSFLQSKKNPAPYHGVPKVSSETLQIFEKAGKLFTVDVVVKTRRNTSWQGNVYSTDGTKLGSFESDIELLQLFLLYDQ